VAVKSPSELLQNSLRNLYEVFSVYPFRKNMPCCVPHCFSKEEIEALNAPLTSLGEKELSSFTWSLLLTCGETEDFKYFLPRLFELSVTSQHYFCDTEIVLGKLDRAGFSAWPAHEQAAVLEFLREWWLAIISTPSEHRNPSSSELLTGLCCANLGVKPFLDGWLELTSFQAALHLADFVTDTSTGLAMGKTFNAFLEQKHLPVIRTWLFSDKTCQYLEDAFFTYSERRESERLSFAVDILTSLKHFAV
jgi:hypothetical protein